MTFAQYVTGIIDIINIVIVPVIFALAFVVFIWGVFKYFIWGAENESEKADGRKFAMWCILGIVVLLSVWGLVSILLSTLGIAPSA